MTLTDDIHKGVRAWILAATGLAPDRVLPADDNGPRRDLPYITMRLASQDNRVYWPELAQSVDTGTGEILENVREEFRTTLQLDAYGTGSDDLLRLCAKSLRLTSTRTQLYALRLALRPIGPINDLSATVDTEIEKRFTRDFDLTYGSQYSETQTGPPVMDTLDTEFDFSGQSTPIVIED